MRVGLLTRFMGVLGIIVGVLFIIPQLEGQIPFVKIVWLLGLSLLFLQRWPKAMPPAWVTGEAQPWPTQQEIREARMAAQAERGGGRAGGEGAASAARPCRAAGDAGARSAAARTKPHSSSKKKKRKRR